MRKVAIFAVTDILAGPVLARLTSYSVRQKLFGSTIALFGLWFVAE